MLNQSLAALAVLTLHKFDAIGVVAQKMGVHAFRIAVAEDGALERLLGCEVLKLDGYVIFEPKQRVVVEHLQLQDILIIEEIGEVIELFVEGLDISPKR